MGNDSLGVTLEEASDEASRLSMEYDWVYFIVEQEGGYYCKANLSSDDRLAMRYYGGYPCLG